MASSSSPCRAIRVEPLLGVSIAGSRSMEGSLLRQKCVLRTGSCFRVVRSSTRRVVCPRAEQSFQSSPKPPKGVTQPPSSPGLPPAKFGFVDNAERLNSRAAMIGFFALIAVEVLLGRGLLEFVGLKVGNGLPFEI